MWISRERKFERNRRSVQKLKKEAIPTKGEVTEKKDWKEQVDLYEIESD